MSIEYETTAEQRAIARAVAAKTKPRRRLRPESPMNEFMRSGRQRITEKEEARITAKVAKVEQPPEADDLRELREQAAADREEAASLRRRAESLRKLAGS